MPYITRIAEPTLRRYLNTFPVLGLTGPRQSGKSTLLKHMLSDYTYITFDDTRYILSFNDDPVGFLNQYNHKIIFDEVQHVPEIFNRIKIHVDENRSIKGNFILTSSSQFQFMQRVTESLAGRIGLMSLLPFQYAEMPNAHIQDCIFRGSYPELVMQNYQESNLWYASYIETYLNKDVRAIAQIGDMRDFRQFLQLLASNASELLDMSQYARDIGVSVPTIRRWLSILEASYIIFIVPPYYENYGKRIVKSPKVYFYDTGIISYFTGISTYEQFEQGPMAGRLFENYVVSEIMKNELHLARLSEIYYLRTQDKAEIDLIVDRKTKKDFIEIKMTSSFSPRMIQHLERYTTEGNRSLLLYRGQKLQHRNVEIMPYWDYLKEK